MNAFGNVDDAPYFCGENVPDYRAEAFDEAKKLAKTFAHAYILYNGLYYHVTCSYSAVVGFWRKKGYKLIHTELSEAAKRQAQV